MATVEALPEIDREDSPAYPVESYEPPRRRRRKPPISIAALRLLADEDAAPGADQFFDHAQLNAMKIEVGVALSDQQKSRIGKSAGEVGDREELFDARNGAHRRCNRTSRHLLELRAQPQQAIESESESPHATALSAMAWDLVEAISAASRRSPAGDRAPRLCCRPSAAARSRPAVRGRDRP